MKPKNGRRPNAEELELNQILRNAELAHIAEEAKSLGEVQLEKQASDLLKAGSATTQNVTELQGQLAYVQACNDWVASHPDLSATAASVQQGA